MPLVFFSFYFAIPPICVIGFVLWEYAYLWYLVTYLLYFFIGFVNFKDRKLLYAEHRQFKKNVARSSPQTLHTRRKSLVIRSNRSLISEYSLTDTSSMVKYVNSVTDRNVQRDFIKASQKKRFAHFFTEVISDTLANLWCQHSSICPKTDYTLVFLLWIIRKQ